MEFQPHFVTGDMFLAYTGINLDDKLRHNDNDSDRVNTFLFRVENRLMSWIDKNTFRVYDYYHLTPFQLEKFQCAILEQALYMWRNGDIAMDSGYDQERGMVADNRMLEEITVCRPCINFLTQAGLFNLKIKNRKRFWQGGGNEFNHEGGIPKEK